MPYQLRSSIACAGFVCFIPLFDGILLLLRHQAQLLNTLRGRFQEGWIERSSGPRVRLEERLYGSTYVSHTPTFLTGDGPASLR